MQRMKDMQPAIVIKDRMTVLLALVTVQMLSRCALHPYKVMPCIEMVVSYIPSYIY